MVSEISNETEIPAPAAKVWELYGTVEFAKFLPLHLPNVIEKIEFLEGDGSEGTLLHVTFAPGLGGARYKEKLVKVDNEKRLKIAQIMEGSYLDQGFSLYRFCFQIIEKDEGSCIVKSTVQYELKEEAAENASLANVQPLIAIAQAAKNYFLNSQQPKDDA
ncbi:norbelladine synthase-like [Benincasa hispida]|uniref:norbelladine synthase-like n=1 Tax=Benincasa hispida TaxID=102211 RepID=UPI001901339A|nr:norbelladine synthase-like [Benincasa hispida]